MARPLYSVSIFQQVGFNGTLSLGPPAGFRWVIRDIAAYASASLSAADLHVQGALGQTFFFFHCPSLSTTFTHEECRVVILEGESLTLNADNPIDVTISGYALTVP